MKPDEQFHARVAKQVGAVSQAEVEELRSDKARLDWLLNCTAWFDICFQKDLRIGTKVIKANRAAIDAAMKE